MAGRGVLAGRAVEAGSPSSGEDCRDNFSRYPVYGVII